MAQTRAATAGRNIDTVSAPARPLAGRGGWRLDRTVWLSIAVYGVLAVLAYLPAWSHGPGHTLNCGGCGDNGQEVWFLAWGAHALTNLEDPLRTTWLHYPWGADLANNTAMPLLGLLGTPITLLFGPVATYNLLLWLAFVASATAAMFACRRWVRSSTAAFLGGLLYGFSPFMVGQGAGHLFMLMAFVPPLLLLVLHDILVRRAWSPQRAGLLLGLLVIVQLGISEEVLAEDGLIAVAGVVLYALFRRSELRANWVHVTRSLTLGLGIAFPFVVAVLIIGRTGPEHASGPIHPVSLLAGISTDLLSPIVPTLNQHFHFGVGTYGSKLVALTPTGKPPQPDTTENGAYIGLPLLLLMLLGGWRYRRESVVRFAWAMAIVSFVMSMGAHLHAGWSWTRLPLPFVVLTHLPLFDNEAASRYTQFLWVFVAVLVAVIVDRWIFEHRDSGAAGVGRGRALTSRLVPAALVVLGLISLVPTWPYPIASAAVPPWFKSSSERHVPVGSVLLTYPYATNSHNLPMFWQAVNGIRYRIPAGEVAVPNDHYASIQLAFDLCWLQPTLRVPPAKLIRPARHDLIAWDVRTLVVPYQYTINPTCAVRFLTTVLHRGPGTEHQASVWRLPGTS